MRRRHRHDGVMIIDSRTWRDSQPSTWFAFETLYSRPWLMCDTSCDLLMPVFLFSAIASIPSVQALLYPTFIAHEGLIARAVKLVISDTLIAHFTFFIIYALNAFYAALLPRRGPHIASHSVCLSVCPSVPLSLPLVTSFRPR